MSINQVFITGNLTRDPEMRNTASGMSILSFGVAVNDRRRNQTTGEWEDYANFVDCKMFGNRANALQRYLHKGLKVAISGKLSWHQWETNDGQKRSKLEVICNEIEFMSPRQSQDEYGAGGYGAGSYAQAPSMAAGNQHRPSGSEVPAPAPAPAGSAYDDEDIPF